MVEGVIPGSIGRYTSFEDDAFRNSKSVKLFFEERHYFVVQRQKKIHIGRYAQTISNVIEMLTSSWG